MRFVGFEGGRDGKFGGRVTIKNVDEFLFFDGTDHHSTAFGVNSEVLGEGGGG